MIYTWFTPDLHMIYAWFTPDLHLFCTLQLQNPEDRERHRQLIEAGARKEVDRLRRQLQVLMRCKSGVNLGHGGVQAPPPATGVNQV